MTRARPVLISCLALVGMFMTGCWPDEGLPSVDPSAESDALTYLPECDASMVVSDVCAGPWEYQDYPWCLVPAADDAPDCVSGECGLDLACHRWSCGSQAGVDNTTTTVELYEPDENGHWYNPDMYSCDDFDCSLVFPSGQVFYACQWSWCDCPDAPDTEVTGDYGTYGQCRLGLSVCGSELEKRKQQLRDQYDDNITFTSATASASTIPDLMTQPSPWFYNRYQCEMQIEYVHATACRLPECGCESCKVQDARCGDFELHFSPWGQTLDQAGDYADGVSQAAGGFPDRSFDFECTSCDDMPAANPAAAQAKMACIEQRRAVGPMPAGEEASLDAKLVAHSKLVYELFGHLLTDAQRTAVRSLYEIYPATVPACGSRTDYDAACPEVAAPWQFGYCARLAGAHVAPELIWLEGGHTGPDDTVFMTCAGLFDSVDEASCVGNGDRCVRGEQCCSGVCSRTLRCEAADCSNQAAGRAEAETDEGLPVNGLTDGRYDNPIYLTEPAGWRYVTLTFPRSVSIDRVTAYLNYGLAAASVRVEVARHNRFGVEWVLAAKGTVQSHYDRFRRVHQASLSFPLQTTDMVRLHVNTLTLVPRDPDHVPGLTEIGAAHCSDLHSQACATGGSVVTASVDEAVAINRVLMDKIFAGFAKDFHQAFSTGDDAQSMALSSKVMSFVDRYYAILADMVATDVADDELASMVARLFKAIEEAADLRQYLQALLAPVIPEEGGDPVDVEAGLAQIASNAEGVRQAIEDTINRAMGLDQIMLKAAVQTGPDGAPVLSGKPLAAVLGELFYSLAGRLEVQSRFHDVACLFANCSAPGFSTPLSETWHLLATVQDQTALAEAVAQAGPVAGWRDAFGAVLQNHDALSDALVSVGLAGQASTGFAGVDLNQVVSPARKLAAALRKGALRYQSFAATGLFGKATIRQLQSRLHAANRDRILDLIEYQRADLESRQAEFFSGITRLAHDIVTESGNLATIARLESQRDMLLDEYTVLEEQRDAHIQAYQTYDIFSELTAEFADIEGAYHDGDYFVVDSLPQQWLSAADAKYSGSRTTIQSLTNLQPIQMDADQILSLHTTGQWAPACSLSLASIAEPDGSGFGQIELSEPTTGPEGYGISWTGTSYQTYDNHTSSNGSFTVGANAEACIQYGSSSLLEIAGLSGWVKGCAYTDLNYNYRWGDAWDNGTDARTSASFSSGLHLSNTPFPEAPVGSLVVVELPRGQTDMRYLRDVHLVRSPQTAIPVSQDADLYFVVNDAVSAQCSGPDSTNQLEVQAAILQSELGVSRQLLSRIAVVLAGLRSQGAGFVARGELLPEERTLLRDEAYLTALSGMDLGGIGPVPVEQYPAPLRALFEAFLSREVVRIERAVRLSNIERELDVLVDKLNEIKTDIDFAIRDNAILSQLPAWSIRNLDLDFMVFEARLLASAFTTFVHPVLDLWYPDVLGALSGTDSLSAFLGDDYDTLDGDPIQVVQDILGAQPGELVSDQIDSLTELVHSVEQIVPFADLRGRDTSGAIIPITVSFHRPGVDCGVNCTPYKTADAARAQEVWEAIEQGGHALVPIYPSDVYAPTGNGTLGCDSQLPVVHFIGFAIVRDGDPRNDYPDLLPRSTVLVGLSQQFTTAAGPVDYLLAEPTLQPISEVPVVFSDVGDPRTKLQAEFFSASGPTHDPVGLSPFTVFDVDFSLIQPSDLSGPFSQATELVVVMWVERINTDPDGVAGVATCQ